VVYLQQGIAKDFISTSTATVEDKIDRDVKVVDVNISTEGEKGISAKDLTKAFSNDENKDEDPTYDRLSSIINFLKDRLPDVKLKVFRVTTPNGDDIPKIVKKLMEQVGTQEIEGAESPKEPFDSAEEFEERSSNSNNSVLIEEVKKATPMRLIVGGMLQNAAARKLPKVSTRVPARIECRNKDSFLLHIEESAALVQEKELLASLKGAMLMTQSTSDSHMTSKAVSDTKIPFKVLL
jgi:hypothetical protein